MNGTSGGGSQLGHNLLKNLQLNQAVAFFFFF